MSSSRYVSRHAPARRTRLSLPSIGGAGVARTAAKSVAGVGIVLGSGAFVIAPTSAIGSADADRSAALGAQQSVADDLLAERSGDTGSSRAAQRSSPVAISAPSTAKGADEASAGELDVDAVAKPKPKPKADPAEEKATAEAEGESTPAPETEETTPAAPEATDSEQPEEASHTEAAESSESSTESSESSDGGAPETGNYAAEAAEAGLGPNAQQVYSAVRTEFPDMSDIGGYRAGDSGDHGSGNAVDVMVSGSRGDQVAAWVQQNAGSLNVKYVIWKQRIWHPGGGWEPMADRGDPTQNHFDHVHISVN